MKQLYKIDSKGKIRLWKICTVDNLLIQEAGLVDGKLVKNSKICTPKNIGKSNETTGEQQALLEMESEYKSKLDENYYPTVEEAQNNTKVLPMLAKSYADHKHKIDWNNCWLQRKYDGMRCLAKCTKEGNVTLISRDGKIIENMQHIINELSTIKQDIILDGELWMEGSFQENMKAIKKYREGITEQILFNVYDVVDNQLSFPERRKIVNEVCAKIKNLWVVHTYKISNEEELKIHHKKFISQGFEGSIVRWGNAFYKIDGRSENLLKYKDFQDLALPIKDIEPATQRPEWGVPVFEWKGATNDELRAGMKFSHEERVEMLKNKQNYIGKTAELRFFEYSEEGVPRFPVMVGIRLDK